MRTQKDIARRRTTRLKRQLQNTIEGSMAHVVANPHINFKRTVSADVRKMMRRFSRQEAKRLNFGVLGNINLKSRKFAKYRPQGGVDEKGVDDIIIRKYNPVTKEYEPVLIIKSKVVEQTFDLNVPVDMVDVVTGSKSLLEPKEIEGFDELIDILGVPDAIKLSFNADANFAIGIASSFDIVGFINGEDSGKVFAYAPTGSGGPVSFTSGFGASFSVEVGMVFDNGSLDDFDKNIFEGKEASLSGSYGSLGASVFLGIGGFGLPTYQGFTIGRSWGTPFDLNGTLWAPDSYLLDMDLNKKQE